MPRRDRSAVGDATAAPLLPKTATLLTKMPSPKAVSLPLLLMPPVKLPTFLETSIAALLTEMAPRISNATPRAAGAEHRDAADHDTMRLRGDRAAVADTAGEGRNQLDLDAVGAGRNPAAAVIDDAAGEERGVVDKNARVGVPTGNRAAIGNAAGEARYRKQLVLLGVAPTTMPSPDFAMIVPPLLLPIPPAKVSTRIEANSSQRCQ